MLTFREFIYICEGKKTPPGAVKGTYQEKDGVKTYTLAPYEGPSGPLGSEKKVMKTLDKQGGIGGGAIKKAKKKAKKIQKIEEQDPQMKPTAFNIRKSIEQAKGGIAQRKHVHQEIAATARAQEAQHQKRLNKLISR